MKRLCIAALIAASSLYAYGQDKDELKDKEWRLNGVTGVNVSQTALSNWSAGGENSLAGNIYLNGSLKHKDGNWLWVNDLILDYGLTKTSSQGMRKTSDKIDFSSQLGYSTNNKWFYTIMGSFHSQFYKGYDYSIEDSHFISKFFAPAYLNASGGMEYRLKEHYSVYFSPIAVKMTFVENPYLSNLGAFGVDPGDTFKAELGMYLKGKVEQELMENVKLISTADFFTPYDNSFGNIDINWDLLISMKVNKFLSATLNTSLIYDNDVKTFDSDGNKRGAKVQFKEMLGIGISYNF